MGNQPNGGRRPLCLPSDQRQRRCTAKPRVAQRTLVGIGCVCPSSAEGVSGAGQVVYNPVWGWKGDAGTSVTQGALRDPGLCCGTASRFRVWGRRVRAMPGDRRRLPVVTNVHISILPCSSPASNAGTAREEVDRTTETGYPRSCGSCGALEFEGLPG